MAYDIIIGRDEADKVKFGNEGLIYLGKGYVKMGTTSSLSNKIMMDVARSHVCLIAGKRGCLVGDTSIFTNKGYKSIKDFDEKNDKVLSFNKDKKSFEWENAQLLKYPIKDEKLLKIEFTDGREIILTKEHPLLSVSGNELLHLQWTNANELMRGDEILSIGKSSEELLPLKIKNIEEAEGITEVYDLSVDKNHSFIANGIISHNSGKSYTLGVIAEELANLPGNIAGNIATLIFDTMGIFWTMAYENEKEGDLLKEWQMQPRKLPVRIFVPFGYAKKYEEMGIPVTSSFAIKTSELDADDWVLTFGLEMLSPPSILIQRVINELRERKKEFDLDDILFFIKNDVDADKDTKAAATNLFEAAGTWGIFARKNEKGTAIKELV
ncbi:MAG: DUF87 domain-containing protein, partial [Nanoarchaeota archaeon]|nr:DUF87 domain-containing protein [Nanoarchaeota archaeon]